MLAATNMETLAKVNCWWPEARKWRLPLRAFFMGGTRHSSVKRSKAPTVFKNLQCKTVSVDDNCNLGDSTLISSQVSFFVEVISPVILNLKIELDCVFLSHSWIPQKCSANTVLQEVF